MNIMITPLLKIFTSIAVIFFFITANAQTGKPIERLPPGTSAPSNAAQEPINFDGTYQRRGPDGDCCFNGPKGKMLTNADLIISGKTGTFTSFDNRYLSSYDRACFSGTIPVEVIETHGEYLSILFIRKQKGLPNCDDSVSHFKILHSGGSVTLTLPDFPPNTYMYKKTTN